MTLSCKLFILSIRKTIRTGKKEFDHIAFVELFTAHLLEKKSRFYHLPKPRYMRNKKMLQHYGHPQYVKIKNVTFSSNTLLYFKLHLMFNINMLKDAARSGLSPYI